MVANGLSPVGALLVAVGPYRRDPGAQRCVRHVQGRIATNVLRRRQPAPSVSAAVSATVNLSAEGASPPLKPDPAGPIGERVARLKGNIEILAHSIRAQDAARTNSDREMAMHE